MSEAAFVVMTTVADAASAATIAADLLERREAACIQELEIRSHYRWEGEVRSDPERLLLVKTTAAARDAAMATIRRLHSYELPEIIALPVDAGLPEYLAWLGTETGRETAD
jgi:periplasmic divalent cation tolerance protein